MGYKIVSEITKKRMSVAQRKRSRKVMELESGTIYACAADAAVAAGVTPGAMCNHLNGRTLSAGGRAWVYIKDVLAVDRAIGVNRTLDRGQSSRHRGQSSLDRGLGDPASGSSQGLLSGIAFIGTEQAGEEETQTQTQTARANALAEAEQGGGGQ